MLFRTVSSFAKAVGVSVRLRAFSIKPMTVIGVSHNVQRHIHTVASGTSAKESSTRPLTSNTRQRSTVAVTDEVSPIHLQVNDDRTVVSIEFEDGKSADAHVMWMKHNCWCTSCRHASGQKIRFTRDMVGESTIAEVSVASSGEWIGVTADEQGSEHTMWFPTDWLKKNLYEETHQGDPYQPDPMTGAMDIRTISYDDYMHEDNNGLFTSMKHVNETGFCLITGVPARPGFVSKIAERIAPIQQTIYDDVFELKNIPDAINVAYTTLALDLHQDLAYYESVMGLQHLHCITYDKSVVGGESTYVDGFYAAELLRSTNTEAFEILSTVEATFHKDRETEGHEVYMEYRRPHIVTAASGAVVGINWAPTFEGVLSVPISEVGAYYWAYDQFVRILEGEVDPNIVIRLRMEPGYCMTFNNRRILHGREAFKNSAKGERWFQGTYTNIDHYLNKYRTLGRSLGKDMKYFKRVGNQSGH
eukprot:GFYU01006450.1.p1 GENE.GFYU01006450.1~~GFYU01006450.1.p1  ORF type:complete len:474 (-),score=82.65 GFYU01006450.1:257-1678(-)